MRIIAYDIPHGQKVVHSKALRKYCEEHGQDFVRCDTLFASIGDKKEIYLIDNMEPIGCIILTTGFDMHHGYVNRFAACWVSKDAPEGSSKRLFEAAMRNCQCPKYQRSRHLDASRQLIITKEVPQWVS